MWRNGFYCVSFLLFLRRVRNSHRQQKGFSFSFLCQLNQAFYFLSIKDSNVTSNTRTCILQKTARNCKLIGCDSYSAAAVSCLGFNSHVSHIVRCLSVLLARCRCQCHSSATKTGCSLVQCSAGIPSLLRSKKM